MSHDAELSRRWRLILGPYADESGSGSNSTHGQRGDLNQSDQERDRLLNYLYQREYQQRQYDGSDAGDDNERHGGRERSRLTAPQWLGKVRELFPKSSSETLQRQALERYGLDQLLTDPEVLEQATPSMELVRTLLSCRALLPPSAMSATRRLIRKVVNDLEKKLAQKIRNSIIGPRQRGLHGGRSQLSNLDWATTLRRNLKHYDPDQQTLALERLYFWQRERRKLRWDIIVLVDQSGSMLDSVIHSAVLAAIFTGLQTLKTRLILFDTSVVDVSDQIGDPVEVLLGIQLGGGTDIACAMSYAASKVENPRRTLLVLITDFYEGGDAKSLLTVSKRLHDSGVKQLGLAALDERAEPDYNRQLAQKLNNIGMEIGAMTPDRLADWVGDAIR